MRLLLLAFLLSTQNAFADLYVIAHKSFSEDTLSISTLRNVYSGDSQHINNLRIIPLDQMVNSKNYLEFYSAVINKPMDQIISHWSKLIFTGKGQSPISLSSDMSIVDFVQKNPNAIGYVGPEFLSNNVKVIHTIKTSK
jgi:ABC-type phosphate transport system substrate-binding protein